MAWGSFKSDRELELGFGAGVLGGASRETEVCGKGGRQQPGASPGNTGSALDPCRQHPPLLAKLRWGEQETGVARLVI